MTIQALKGAFSVCHVKDLSGVDWECPFTFVSRTDDELSLVCPSEAVPGNAVKCERGWRAFRIQGMLDFSLTGILARMTAVLAERQIPVFALSTYNTDYVLVKEDCFRAALQALSENGYEVTED